MEDDFLKGGIFGMGDFFDMGRLFLLCRNFLEDMKKFMIFFSIF